MFGLLGVLTHVFRFMMAQQLLCSENFQLAEKKEKGCSEPLIQVRPKISLKIALAGMKKMLGRKRIFDETDESPNSESESEKIPQPPKSRPKTAAERQKESRDRKKNGQPPAKKGRRKNEGMFLAVNFF